MLLSVLSLWGSLLTLVASQSCPDPSENSASWVRLKPLGQCKDGESTCPYRITLPSLTIQLPKPFRDLEKMVKELQSLTQMVNQLREDCRECKERQGMDWSTSTDDEREDGERIQASEKTFNTRDSQQDIAEREHTVQVTTSRSAVEDSAVVISSEAKDENPTAFGKQWNTNQERNVNQHTTKPRSEKNGGTKGFNPLREKTISESISKVGEVPSLTTAKKKILQFPLAELTESSIPRDREQPTQESQKQSQGQSNTNKVRNEMYPGTLTAKGKVKSIPEYHVVSMTTEDVDDNDYDKEDDNEDDDDDVETKQLQTPKGENVPGEKQPVTGTDAQNNRELEPRIKQLPRKQQDKENKKAVADTGLKELRSSIFEDTNNRNVAKEGSVSVVQEPTFKNMKKNNHGERSTKLKVLKPGSHSESQVNLRPVNTDDTIRGQKKLTSPNTGRANASVNVSQINPQTLEIKSKNAFKSKLDGKMDTGVKLKFNSSETVNGQVITTSTIAGMTYDIVDVGPTNPQTLDSIKKLNTGTDLESGIKFNPANNTDRVSGVKNSGSLDSINARPDVDLIHPNIQKGKFQTPLKSGTDVERNTGIDSNIVNRQNNSRLSISEITDGIVDVSQTNPQILDSKNQEDTNFESETGIDSNPIKNNDTVSVKNNSGLSVSDRIHAKAYPKKQSSNSQSSLQSSKNGTSSTEINSKSVNGIKNSRAPISGITNDMVDISLTNPQTAHGKDQVKTGPDPRNDDRVVSNPLNNIKTVSGQNTSRSPISDITYGIVDVSPKNHQIDQQNKFRTGTDSESDVVRYSNPVQNIATTNGQKNLRASISDRANSTADIDIINLPSLNSPKPFTNGIDAKSNNGMDSHISITSEKVSQLQTPKSPFSGITDAVAGNQTYPGTFDSNGFKNPFKPLINKDDLLKRNNKTDSNALKVETNRSLEMPQLSISDRPDAPDNVNLINPQTVYNNFKNTTEVSTPFINTETDSQLETPKSPVSDRSHATSDQINPQEIDYITKTTIKPGANSETKAEIHPNRDHTVDTVSQQERSESSISDSRRDVNGTNHSLNSKYDLPKNRNPKLNVTQPRNGKFRIPNPMSINNERRKEQSSNTTTSLRNDAKKSGRHLPTGDLPTSQGKQHKIKHQPERTSTGRINIGKDPRHRKPYILQRIPLNESKAFGSGRTKNTSGIIDYIMSQTESSTNNELNSTVYGMGQSVRPTLAPQGVVDEAHLKRTAPTVAVVHTRFNPQIESTSQATTTKQRPEHTGGHSGHAPVLDKAKNLERGSKLPLVEKKKDTHRRTEQGPFKTSRVDSNQKKTEKSLREGSNQHSLVDISNERNGLNYATTAATPYTINTEFKNKSSKTTQFTAPIITTTHLLDQDHAEQAKTTSGVKVSNKQARHRLENPSQEIESKRSHSDTGNKELQSASNGQESSALTNLQPNSLDTIQNIANGSTALILDKVMAGPGSKVSTTSSKHTHENRARDTNTVAMDKVETITEAIPLTPSADNAPVTNQSYSKTPLGSTDLVVGNNGKHSIDKNNVNRMTGTSLDQMPAGHTNDGSNKKPLTVNNMDIRQGIEKQLLSNCHDQCDHGPTPQSILNSHESSKDNKDKLPQDCSDFMKNPKSGIYNVTPTGSGNTTFPVFCDMKSSGGGWTLIQHRLNGNVSFNRTWNDYKGGFGNLMGEFWLGNDKIHWLTTTKAMALRIELEDLDGIKEYAQYDQFHVANESQYYRLTIEGYSGTAGDAMLYSKKFNHNQKNFTTPDRDNDQYTSGNCGAYYSSGWWFDACMAANLNGKYYETRYKGVRNGIFWGTWHNISTESYPTNERQSFKTVRMMIRPREGLLMD